VLTIGIAMRNLVNYDSAGLVPNGIAMRNLVKYKDLPRCFLVPFGIPMRNLVNSKYTISCADRHHHLFKSSLKQIHAARVYVEHHKAYGIFTTLTNCGPTLTHHTYWMILIVLRVMVFLDNSDHSI